MALPTIDAYAIDADAWRTANVTDWSPRPDRAVLLVHDMQAHFVSVFDRAPGSQIEAAVAHTARLSSEAREAGVPVVYTAQPPAQDPADRALLTDFWGAGLQDERAADIIPELAPRAGDEVLTKWRYSAFYRSDLRERMTQQGRDQLVVTGVYAHIGCLTTALVAFMDGIQVFFVADAMADFGAAEHEMAARYVAGRCGQLVPTAEISAALTAAPVAATPVTVAR